MLSRKYFVSLAAAALLLISAGLAFAQTAPVRGVVVKAGTGEPVAGATVEAYRTDAKGKLPSAKTDKKGNFSFAGFPLAQTFALVVSGPGIAPMVQPKIQAGMDTVKIEVSDGDGKTLSEDDVRTSLTVKPKTGGSTTSTTSQGPSPEDVEAAKKAKAEYDAKVAEVTAKNEKAKNTNELVKKALEEGNAAYTAKNYDLAVSKFDEGYNADPGFVGSAPIFLNNKALSLRYRGLDAYNKGKADAANKAALLEKAKSDFTDGIAAGNKTLELVKNAPADPATQKTNDASKYNALSSNVELYRLLIATGADPSKNKEAVEALQAYEAAETNAAQKLKTQILMADVLRTAGNADDALPIYRRALEAAPDNVDAIGGAGLSLFAVGAGASPPSKEQMQEGLNLMQKFADSAPDSHPLKSSVKEAVLYLKDTEKLTPQKVTTATPKKRP